MTRALLIALLVLSGCRCASEQTPARSAEAPAEAPPFGGLDVVVVGDGDGPAVVLLHGYGTPPDDLVPLARQLVQDPRLANHRFVLPAGRLPASGTGRMWWPIPPRPMREALVQSGERVVAEEHPPELPASRAAVLALVADLERRFSLPPERIAIGGFSQGAMLAVDVSLHRDGAVGPVVAMSGSVVAERDWRPHAGAVRGTRVFVSHGRLDSVLPYAGAEHLRDFLSDAGAEVRFHPFDGDHTIERDVLDAVADFLADALPSRP